MNNNEYYIGGNENEEEFEEEGEIFDEYYQNMITKSRIIPYFLEIESKEQFENYNYQLSEMLHSLHIKRGVDIIRQDTFLGCSSLKFIKLEGVKNIEYHAFLACVNLEYFEISNDIEEIHPEAFNAIEKNKKICLTIPNKCIPFFKKIFPFSTINKNIY